MTLAKTEGMSENDSLRSLLYVFKEARFKRTHDVKLGLHPRLATYPEVKELCDQLRKFAVARLAEMMPTMTAPSMALSVADERRIGSKN